MLTKYVQVGNKIDLQVVDDSFQDPDPKTLRHVYKSKVYDIMGEDQLQILMPIEKGKLILLQMGIVYELCFYTSNGLYQCLARATERYKNNNIYLVRMELTTNVRKYQRREYYRLDCVLPTSYLPIRETDLKRLDVVLDFENSKKKPVGAIMVDLSGGGIRFLTSEALEEKGFVLIFFRLNIEQETRDYTLVGRVILSEEIENRDGQYENRVQFVEMTKEEREEIIRFIFEEQRKSRRKEKGIE